MASSNTRIQGITIEIGGKTDKLQSALKNVNSTIKKTQSALKDVNTLLKLDPKNTTLLKQKQDLLKDAVNSTKEKLEQEKLALEQLQSAGNTAETTRQQEALKREIIATTQELERLEGESKQAASVLSTQMQLAGKDIQEAGKKIKEVGDGIGAVGNTLTTKVTAPIVGLGAASIGAASQFEDAMAKVSTIANESEKPLSELEEEIKQLSNETGISAAEIADNVYNAISAGQKTGDAVAFVGNATKLAKAGFTDSASALDILTTTLNAYGMEADEVTRVSDVLINTQNLGKTTVGELAAAMGKVIPTAKANGVELESLAGAYAVMTANGIKTAETTTYLNSMLNELGKQGTNAANAFAKGTEHIKEGGLTMAEAMEMGWDLTDVLSILDEQAAESGTSIANMFGSAEAGKAANVLWDQADKLNTAVESMGKSAGATDEAFAKLDTNSFKAKKSLNELKNASIEMGTEGLEMLAPIIDKVTSKISEFTTWLSSLDDPQKQTIITILAVIAALGPALIVIGKVVGIVGSVVTGIGTLTTTLGIAMTFISGTAIPAVVGFVATFWPLILVIAAVVAAVVAVIAIIKNWGKITDWFKDKWAKFSKAIEGISVVFDTLVNAGKEWGKDMVNNFINGIKEKWEDLKKTVSNLAETIASYLHFSVPDVGPLKHADTWMPDMVDLMSTTLSRSSDNIDPALEKFASKIAGGINASGGVNGAMQSGKIEIEIVPNEQRFFKAMVRQNDNFKRRTGYTAM